MTTAQATADVPFDALSTRPFGPDPHGPPLLVEPRGDRSLGMLLAWLAQNREAVASARLRLGALLFRGFDVDGPDDFERVARAIDPALEKDYLGTSPRDAITPYVFSASELPGFYPIPQHCEMTFIKDPPRSLFFCCLVAPDEGGETPLCDFRAVARDMRADVRERFERGGLRIIRNYAGPDDLGRFDLMELKPWTSMFHTRDHAAVEAKARAEGFEPTWGPRERLRLVSHHDCFAKHPVSGEDVWFNHVQVFRLDSGPAELTRIFAKRPSLRAFGTMALAKALVAVKKRAVRSEDQAMHCTYRDGREIPDDDVEHVRDLIWRHLVVYRWQRGDVLAIDNRSVSHGRLPYAGPRKIVVSWA